MHIISTNQDGVIKRVDGDMYYVDFPTGVQISVVSSDLQYHPPAGERPILAEDVSGGL